MAITGGIISGCLALEEIMTVQFTPPCYIRPLLSKVVPDSFHGEKINCCGMEQNIYAFGNSTDMCRSSVQAVM